MTTVTTVTMTETPASSYKDTPMDAKQIIENINATVTARYTLAKPVYVPSGISNLCSPCRAIFSITSLSSPIIHEGQRQGEVIHQNLEDVAEAVRNGCHLCITVYTSLDPVTLRAFRRYVDSNHGRNSPDSSFAGHSIGFASITPIARDQARLNFRWTPNLEVASRSEKGKSLESRSHAIRNESRATSHTTTSSASDHMIEELSVDLILMNPIYAVEPGVRVIGNKSTSTSSDECFEVAKRWIEDCSFSHMKCSATEATETIEKPAYLLDCAVKGPKGVPGVRLVDGQFLDPFTEYVTLSHCWGMSHGSSAKRIRLHKKTLVALRQGVALAHLPKTFAEAANATLKLGFKYLWIDALCIMHDSEKDVLDAVANMHRIYGEATINLAATSAVDDSAGLYSDRNVLTLQPATVEISEGFGIVSGPYKVLRSTIWEDLIDASPLARRSWIFQERCLSKRTLHFTRNELLWECQQMCCSEVFPKGLPVTMKNQAEQEKRNDGAGFLPSSTWNERFSYPPIKLSFNKRTHHQRTANWHSLVELYTDGRQTYTSDKLLGISALARQYMSKNRLKPSDYVAGLWRPSLPHSLLWRVYVGGRRPSKYRAPTWTWASIDGRVMSPAPSQTSKQTCLDIIEIKMKNKRDDPFGLCEAGAMKVRGFIGKGSLRRTRDYWGHCAFSIVPTNRKIGEVRFENAWFDDRLPKLCDESAGIMVETLEIYLTPVIDVMDRVEGLILCATMKKGEFKRIGTFEISNGSGLAGMNLSPEVRGPIQENWDRFKSVMKGDGDMMNFEERLDHTNAYWFASDYTYTINIV